MLYTYTFYFLNIIVQQYNIETTKHKTKKLALKGIIIIIS